jgi:predicted cupin superfamily sugar epimerase
VVTPDEIIQTLDLQPHPEGGHYAETWRGEPVADDRAAGTAIHYLLRAGERSHWHRVDATELWLFHAGGPLSLDVAVSGRSTERVVIGPDLRSGERPQHVVPASAWQTAAPLGSWTLVTCIVVPGFTFDGFELAPDGWTP